MRSKFLYLSSVQIQVEDPLLAKPLKSKIDAHRLHKPVMCGVKLPRFLDHIYQGRNSSQQANS